MEKRNDYSEIDFYDLVMIAWSEKWQLIFVSFLITLLSVLFALSKPDVFTSKIVLELEVEASNLNLGGVGSLLGVPSMGSSGLDKYRGQLESIDLLFEFIKKKEMIGKIYPDAYIQDEVYFSVEGDTITNYDAVKTFKKEHLFLSIGDDKAGAQVVVKIKHDNPKTALTWVSDFSSFMVSRIVEFEKLKNLKALQYYRGKMLQVENIENRVVLSDLIGQELKKGVLIGRAIFDVVEQPREAELKTSPNRKIIVALGFLMGIIVGLFSIIVKKIILSFKVKARGEL
jgi:hypothetical protein